MKSEAYGSACLLVILSLLGLQLGFSACGANPKAAEPVVEHDDGDVEYDRSGTEAVLLGTAIEASTGLLLSGVEILGPGGQRAVTDAEGRFELRGLEPGSQGVIRAEEAALGLKGENRLRSLDRQILEVVIYLR